MPSSGRAILWAILWAWALSGLPTPATPAATPPIAAGNTLKLAAWNMEWLLTPVTFGTLRQHCTTDDDARRPVSRSLPCDVAARLERSATDLAALRRYARQLDADVIALQEVDGAAAARQVFPDHEFCFTGNTALQNNGFAIRRGLPFRCGADLKSLSLGDSVRRGAEVVLFPGSPRAIHLLGVHLKSGCATDRLDSPDSDCQRIAEQAAPLRQWVAAQTAANRRFAVLGDFNRNLLAESRGMQDGLWQRINGGPGAAQLSITAANSHFRNCATGQRYSSYIDYILLGSQLQQQLISGSFERMIWSAEDAGRRKLSDHCPIAVRLRLD